MANLSTTYMGLALRNPIILSSSGLTESAEKIQKAEDAGAAAVIMKSLFEEVINHEAGKEIALTDYTDAHDYILNYTKENSISAYLNELEKAKKSVKIPVFASINAVNKADWKSFAKRTEDAGADGIELNIHIVPTSKEISGADIEERYHTIIEQVKSEVKIPVAVKVSYHFSNLLNFVHRLEAAKVEGIVMFNRFYEPDIDINAMDFKVFSVFSKSDDLRHALRWTGLLSSFKNKIDISLSTGVHTYEDVVKSILAGASATQICSAIYQNGYGEIQKMLDGLENWMGTKTFENISDFKGLMSYKSFKQPEVYERSQFMRYFSNHG